MHPDIVGEWRKSSWSSGQNGNCVEVSRLGIRDTKNPDVVLKVDPATVIAMVKAITSS